MHKLQLLAGVLCSRRNVKGPAERASTRAAAAAADRSSALRDSQGREGVYVCVRQRGRRESRGQCGAREEDDAAQKSHRFPLLEMRPLIAAPGPWAGP
jgi:hypothetical protein